MTNPRLVGIAVKTEHGGPLEPADEAEITVAEGIVGNVPQSSYRRVTLLSRERWEEATRELGVNLPWHIRRANLLVEGLRLEELKGRLIRIGEVELNVNGETKPCSVMDDACYGLQAALQPDWRAGAYAAVQKGGIIRAGDPVTVVE